MAEAGMITRFKRRFVIITMALVGVVSLGAFGTVAVAGFQQVKGVVDQALQQAIDTDSQDTYSRPNLGLGNERGSGREDSVPICLVTVTSGAVSTIAVNQSSTASMAEDTLKAVVSEVLSDMGNGSTEGMLVDYGLYYKVGQGDWGYRIAFADASSVIDDVAERSITLLVFWALLMVALFFVCLFLARFVAKPVESAWKDQQRFIADASHELKTPLTIILANTTILQEDKGKTVAEQETWVEGIAAEAERMQHLTESMLTLAQDDAGVAALQVMGSVDLSSVVESQILQFDAVAFERHLMIEDEIQPDIVLVGDEMRLENMVKTLLENACKYAAQPSTVKVTLSAGKDHALLSVANQGDTIPAEDLPHLFDRFYRSDKARTGSGEAASFGLGLSIAKSTAELHHGSISASSEAGTTVFSVRLPLGK